MAVSGTGEGWSEAGGCLGRAEHRDWGPLGAAGRGRGPAPFVSWLIPVPVLPASPGAAPLGPVWPMEVQIWCEGGVAVMHTWGHTETFTKAHRDRQVCKYKHTDTPRTLHPPLHRYTPTYRHTPQSSPHPLRVSPHAHHKHRGTPTHKGRCPRHGRSHLHKPCTLTTPLSKGVTLTQCHTHASGTNTVSCTYGTAQCHAVSHTQCHSVTHPVSHTPCHPHTAPILPVPARLCRPNRLSLRTVTEPRRALPNRTVPSRNRAEPAVPCRTGPC